MKQEHDFSKGERAKFFHPDVELNFPVYLDRDVAEFIQDIAAKKGTVIEKIVTDRLRRTMDLVRNAR
ncbi:MAG: hypothetical protein V2B18_16170 [Pseudomonadota bacterium]